MTCNDGPIFFGSGLNSGYSQKKDQQLGQIVACQEFNLPVGAQYSHNCTGVTTGANGGPGIFG
jgi:hypothetical protein